MNIAYEKLGYLLAMTLAASTASCSGSEGGSEEEAVGEAQEAVIGGTIATPNSLPYQVQISYNGSHRCGGSLLTNRWILTAAHCLDDVDESSKHLLVVTLGDHDRTTAEPREQVRSVASFFLHERFDRTPMLNDIALIQLSSPVTLNQWVNTIALPDGRYDSVNTLTLSGWGGTGPNMGLSNVLRKVELPLVDQAECAVRMNPVRATVKIAPTMLCAGQLNPLLAGCAGDSGGPLASIDSPRRLVGVVSWGVPQACNLYTVFTRVSDYIPWIRQKVYGETPIACVGQALATDISWNANGPESIYTTINTSQCAYSQTPAYFASLTGTGGLDAATSGVNSVYEAGANQFAVMVYRKGGITPAQAKTWKWNVNWKAAPKGQTSASLCTGGTPSGSTNWQQAWYGRIFVDVNTAACGRTSTPRYSAALRGAFNNHLLNGVASIYSPTTTGFRLYLEWGPAPSPQSLTPAMANQLGWAVDWAAEPSGNVANPAQCAGTTSSGMWNWTQAGTDVIYTTVNTSACGKLYKPVYFTALRGNQLNDHSGAMGVTSIQQVTPSNFRVYLRQPGATPLAAGTFQYVLDWSAYP